jgi:type IV secretory pathway TrbF-like protein
MLMCHVCQIIPYAVQVDCRGTAAHIGQLKF